MINNKSNSIESGNNFVYAYNMPAEIYITSEVRPSKTKKSYLPFKRKSKNRAAMNHYQQGKKKQPNNSNNQPISHQQQQTNRMSKSNQSIFKSFGSIVDLKKKTEKTSRDLRNCCRIS